MSWDPSRSRTDPRVRAVVLRRDRGVCQIQGPGCTHRATENDHIVPLARGGADAVENCRAVCHTCHEVKSRQERVAARRAIIDAARNEPWAHPGFAAGPPTTEERR